MSNHLNCSKCWKELFEDKEIYFHTKEGELNFEVDGYIICSKCATIKKLSNAKIFKLVLV